MYKIKDYSYKKAKELGVEIKPSKIKNKKIDVFKDGMFLVSIGDIRYNDFATTGDKERRRLYKIRHKNNKGLAGRYANAILW